MRPLRVTLEGFSSFREPTVIDFDGADFFAIVGPTGSGKSSLIDAVAFALYGSVSRYDNRNLVAPIISQGRVEARVGLDFAIGAERYRAVRVVRAAAKGKGATTKEARLERLGRLGGLEGLEGLEGPPDEGAGGEVVETLAGDADGVTAAVTELLGLSFDHFTKCVVLPQGAFARFLHDKPSARQELLVELLNLGVYGEVGRRTNQASTAAADRATLAAEQLAAPPYADATPEAVREAVARVAELDALRITVAAYEPQLAELARREDEAAAAAHAARLRVETLQSVHVPPDVRGLAAALAKADAAVAQATADAALASGAVVDAEAALAVRPARAVLEAAARDHAERAEVVERIDKSQRLLAELGTAAVSARSGLASARADLDAARLARDQVTHAHLAQTLAATLAFGEPCPVCQQPVPRGVLARPAADVGAADAAVDRAEAEATGWADELAAAGVRQAKGEEKLAGLHERLATLDNQLRGYPDAVEAQSMLVDVAAAESTLTAARRDQGAAQARAGDAARINEKLSSKVGAAWSAFDEARDRLAALAPPTSARQDLAKSWDGLARWAGDQRPVEEAAVVAASDQARAAVAARASLVEEAVAACAAKGVQIELRPAGDPDRPIGEVLAEARAGAVAALIRLQEGLAGADRLRDEVASATVQAQVARTLAGHLRSSGFEKWLLDEVLDQLVAGATELLCELSSGAYSLTLDSGGFAVVDHRNADAVRSARTLSGGETFLASLALALALADRLAGFGTAGASLEAIFLDEGFGSLDPDTLDTVAAAIENLAAGGRVVGIVTHVRELADRVPVRFEVEKGPATSTVRRRDG